MRLRAGGRRRSAPMRLGGSHICCTSRRIAKTRFPRYSFAAFSGRERPGFGDSGTIQARPRSETTLKLLDALERPFYAAVRPLVDWLIRSGIKPNTITT